MPEIHVGCERQPHLFTSRGCNKIPQKVACFWTEMLQLSMSRSWYRRHWCWPCFEDQNLTLLWTVESAAASVRTTRSETRGLKTTSKDPMTTWDPTGIDHVVVGRCGVLQHGFAVLRCLLTFAPNSWWSQTRLIFLAKSPVRSRFCIELVHAYLGQHGFWSISELMSAETWTTEPTAGVTNSVMHEVMQHPVIENVRLKHGISRITSQL